MYTNFYLHNIYIYICICVICMYIWKLRNHPLSEVRHLHWTAELQQSEPAGDPRGQQGRPSWAPGRLRGCPVKAAPNLTGFPVNQWVML